jgi:hypothetical protein
MSCSFKSVLSTVLWVPTSATVILSNLATPFHADTTSYKLPFESLHIQETSNSHKKELGSTCP